MSPQYFRPPKGGVDLFNRELALFWARIYAKPKREFPGGPYLPPHEQDLAMIDHLLKVARGDRGPYDQRL